MTDDNKITPPIIEPQRIIIVKLGGSSITDKSKFETPNLDALKWVREALVQSIHPSFLSSSSSSSFPSNSDDVTINNKPAFIVIHGAGSFGHYHAKQFGLKGETEPPSKGKVMASLSSPTSTNHYMTGLAHTRNSVKKLNNIVVSSLLSSSVPSPTSNLETHNLQKGDISINAIGLSPCMNIPSLQAYGGDTQSVSILIQSIKEALRVGLVPVLHGDAGLYGFFENDCMKSGILGGDTLVEIIATSEEWGTKGKDCRLNDNQIITEQIIDKVIFLTDVDGVFTKDPNLFPNDARLIRKIEIDSETGEIDSFEMSGVDQGENKEDIALEVIGSSHEHDVTGGLKAKLGSAATVAKAGVEVQIVRCCSNTALQALQEFGTCDLGTTIKTKQV